MNYSKNKTESYTINYGSSSSQPVQNSQAVPLTCAQKATNLNGYYTEGLNSIDQCKDYAIIDCQQKKEVITGWTIQGDNCCIYQCEPAIPEVEATCTDSDGGQDDQQFIKGTVSFGGVNYVDECDWNDGGVTEYYCDGNTGKSMNIQCENYWTCQDGRCAQQECTSIMNPTPEKCVSGYTTDGGTCLYDTGMEQCVSSKV